MLEVILPVPPHEVFVVTLSVDVPSQKDSLQVDFVDQSELCCERGVVMLIVDKALLLKGEIPEYLLLFLFDFPQTPSTVLVIWILSWVVIIYCKFILKQLPIGWPFIVQTL